MVEYVAHRAEDLPAGLMRQRRNVMLFSIGALIYVLGGGSAPNEITLAWGGVGLARPWVAAVAYLIGFLYSVYRLRVYSVDVEESLRTERLEALYRLPEFSRWCEQVQAEVDAGKRHSRPKVYAKPNWTSPHSVQFIFGQRAEAFGEIGIGSMVNGNGATAELLWSEFNKRFWRHAGVRAAIDFKSASDLVLPRVLAGVSAAIVLVAVWVPLIS